MRATERLLTNMPYKSDAQRRYFHAAEARGEIKPSVVNEFDKASKGMKLPERKNKKSSGPLHEYLRKHS